MVRRSDTDARSLQRIRLIGFCDRAFSACDALWTPVLPMPVPERAATDYGDEPEMAAGLAALTRLTRPLNYLGLPGSLCRPGSFLSLSLDRRIISRCTLALDGKMIDKPHLTLAHRRLGLGTE